MTRATVKNGELVFSSPLARHRFLEKAEGKEIKLEINEKPTNEMRKYFEGCLVPVFFYMHPHSEWTSFADAREVLKLEFSPFVKRVINLDGLEMKIAPSTTDLSKTRFTAFVEAITNWMVDNGIQWEILDPEAYKTWRDTNFTDPIYPPIGRMKASYDRERQSY